MRQLLSILVAVTTFAYVTPVAAASQQPSGEPTTLAQWVQQPYLTLFEKAPSLHFSKQELDAFHDTLEQKKKQDKEQLESKKHSIEDQIDRANDQLKELNKNPSEKGSLEKQRQNLHCKVQSLRKDLEQVKLSLDKGLDNKYENKFAKLKVLQEWPQEYRKVEQTIKEGKVGETKFGDFRDIGFRGGPFEGQKDDIKDGREAIQQMKQNGLMPPEVEDEQVNEYVRSVAARLARHSDLRVPLQVTVLKSKEINAFALPGGFLFVNTGLIMKAGNESQLAGVMAHEIAHVAARHGHRLMAKANIASIIYQAAQVAALVLTGGVASIGTYYALQYGFFGLGLVMNLSLLGVSRDFETEADILGTQYLWAAGYNTDGFVNFFNKMADEEGYVTGLSWFRTHPPFYERMEKTYSEILMLPRQESPTVDSSEFHEAQKRLKGVLEEMEKEDRKAPTLKRVYDCDNQKPDSGSGN